MSIRLTVFPDIFTERPEIHIVEHGKSFCELIDAVGVGRNALVYAGDQAVRPERWDEIPEDGENVLVRAVPGNGAATAGEAIGEFALRILGTAIMGTMDVIVGLTKNDWSFSGTRAVWGSAGSSTKTTTRPSLSGAANQPNKNGPIPLILGKHFIAPVLAGDPYTEIAGTDGCDVYYHLGLIVGYGPLQITKLLLGDNTLAYNASGFADGAITKNGVFPSEDISIDLESCRTTAMANYPTRVHEEKCDMEARCPSGSPVYLQRTSPENATRLEVDIEFPSGLGKYVNSTLGNYSVRVVAQYQAAGGDWSSPTTICDEIFTRSLAYALRFTRGVAVTAGRYDVRVYKMTTDSTGSNVIDTVNWRAFRCFRANDKIVKDAIALKIVRLSLRVKASTVVSGSLDQVACIAQSIVPVYSGSGSGTSSWTASAATSNPAALALWMMRGPANPLPRGDTDIDFSALEELYSWAETTVSTYRGGVATGSEKRAECNTVLTAQGKLEDTLRKIYATCRTSFVKIGNTLSLVHDIPNTTPVALITPRNSWGYRGSKAFMDVPHGYRVTFVSAAANYQEDVCIVLRDGYIYDLYNDGTTRDAFGTAHTTSDTYSGTTYYQLATQLESVEAGWMTSYSQVWREFRYKLAVLTLRPEIHQVSQDFQAIGYSLGALVRFGHDVPLFGSIGGRIKSVTLDGSSNATGFTSDELLFMASGGSYGIRYQRTSDGAICYSDIVTVVGSGNAFTFASSIPAASAPSADDLFWFGPVGSDTAPMIVVGMEGGDNFSRTIYLQDYAAGVYTADSGAIPNYDPHITKPAPVAFGDQVAATATAQVTAARTVAERVTAVTAAAADATAKAQAAQSAAQTAVSSLAPKYLCIGILSALSTAAFTGATVDGNGAIVTGSSVTPNVGDWMYNYDPSTAGILSVYRWSGSAWETSTVTWEHWIAATEDIGRYIKGGTDTTTRTARTPSAWTFFDTLFANDAFLDRLAARLIRSSNYQAGVQGMSIDLANAVMRAENGNWEIDGDGKIRAYDFEAYGMDYQEIDCGEYSASVAEDHFGSGEELDCGDYTPTIPFSVPDRIVDCGYFLGEA